MTNYHKPRPNSEGSALLATLSTDGRDAYRSDHPCQSNAAAGTGIKQVGHHEIGGTFINSPVIISDMSGNCSSRIIINGDEVSGNGLQVGDGVSVTSSQSPDGKEVCHSVIVSNASRSGKPLAIRNGIVESE